MIEQLSNNLLDFGRAEAHTWCFLYTTNLVAKALIKVFDGRLKKWSEEAGMDDKGNLSAKEAQLVSKLEALSEGIEIEDQVAILEQDITDNEKINDIEGLSDEVELLNDREHQELLRNIRPIKLALMKVRNNVHTLCITNSWPASRSTNLHSSSSIRR